MPVDPPDDQHFLRVLRPPGAKGIRAGIEKLRDFFQRPDLFTFHGVGEINVKMVAVAVIAPVIAYFRSGDIPFSIVTYSSAP